MKETKTSLFQTLGTAIALVISILALLVSLYEANLLKDQQRALVWPYLTVTPNYSGKGFSIVATNNGTGPALIKSMEVRYKDTVYTSYDDLLDAIKPGRKIGYDRLRMSTFNNTVMKAGEERIIFNMPWDDETREMAKNMIYLKAKVQYCSVLDDCWVFDSENDGHYQGNFKAEKEFGRDN